MKTFGLKNTLRNNLILIFILLSVIGCKKKNLPIENDVSRMRLNGKVKSMERVIYIEYHNRNNKVKKYSRKGSYLFDSKGRKVEHLILEYDGRFKSKTVREYDNSGNIQNVIMYDSIGDIYLKMIRNYDINGFLIERKSYNSKGDIFSKENLENNVYGDLVKRIDFDKGIENYKEVLSYDKNRNKIERKVYLKDSNGEFYLEIRSLYKYDNEGNLVEKSDFEFEEVLQLRNTRKYDSRGNLSENIHYKSDGSLSRRVVNKFDIRNNKIERLEYDSDDIIESKNQYKFDVSGNEIEDKDFDSDGTLYSIKNRRYDENGNIIESVFKTPNNDKIRKHDYSWEYEYDEYKNWIKRVQYINEEPFETRERKFEYY